MALKIDAIDHIVLTVTDIEKTLQFYQRALGMSEDIFYPSDGSERVALKFGNQKINLHVSGNEFDPKAAFPTPGSADLCFLTLADISSWVDHLSELEIPIEAGPVARSGAMGPINSIYIKDPDGNLIEISKRV